MSDVIITKNKRRTWIAVMLSLIMPGLGQIYCGRLARGLLLSVLNTLPLSLMMMVLLFKNSFLLTISAIILTIFGIIILLIAIIDSIYLVKHIGHNYELKEYNRWYIYLLLIFIGFGSGSGSSYYIKNNICEAFIVPQDTMYPTIIHKDRFLANKTAYNNANPKRGDVVIFTNPEDKKVTFVKRVVAIAGDTVEMKGNQLYINGRQLEHEQLPKQDLANLPNTYMKKRKVEGDFYYEFSGFAKYKIFISTNYFNSKIHDFNEMTIPKNYCFVLGDNRNVSWDSRHFGAIPVSTIKGRAEFIYWPGKDWSNFGKID